MIPFPRLYLVTALSAAVLAACGGGSADLAAPVAPQQPPVAVAPVAPVPPSPPSPPSTQPPSTPSPATQLVFLTSTPQAMQSIAFHNGAAFLSLFNSDTAGTAVLKSSAPLAASAKWAPASLGKCALGPTSENNPGARAPTLKQVAGSLWLLQHWVGAAGVEEHSLCEIDSQGAGFVPKDAGLLACRDGRCDTLSATDIKEVSNRLVINAGAGYNVQVSEDRGVTWRVLNGEFASMVCYDPKFEIIGDRLLVGGECPLDSAYLKAYQLTPYTLQKVSDEPLPLSLPDLENRNIQFIERIAGTSRVFVGTEGGLLRSVDGGKSFQFVIHQPLSEPDMHPVRIGFEPAKYPYIWKILSPAGQPNVIVAAGFDKPNGRPYLVWSADGGDTWTDLSDKLPGYSAAAGGQVTSLVEGPQGQLFITVNEEGTAKGHLMQLTLGKQ
jgi:hypothetical protein